MAYVPDPTNGAAPLGSEVASTAAAEFRALKTYIQGLVAGAVTTVPSVRQTVAAGQQDASGDPAFLVAGAGLALNLVATATPVALTYAAGTGPIGDVNFNEVVAADTVGVVAGLAASNLSYLYKTYAGAWGATLAPVQYGKTFDKGAQALIRWPGANNAVATTEDFGSAVSFLGAAKVSTATQILGGNTLALSGAIGTYASVTSSGMGGGSWELTGSFRLGVTGATQVIVAGASASSSFGLILSVDATNKLSLYLSSTATSWDIANNLLGTTIVAINTTYYFRLTYEANLGRIYQLFLSVAGAAETMEIQVGSFSRLSSISTLFLGASSVNTLPFNGNLGAVSFRRFIKDTNSPLISGPTVQPDYTSVMSDWFNTTAMRMFTPSGPSAAAGANPPMTASNKLYVGEVVTNANAIFSLVNYAYKGRYESPFGAIPGVAIVMSANHNLGLFTGLTGRFELKCITAELGFSVDDLITNGISGYTGTFGYSVTPTVSKLSIKLATPNANTFTLSSLGGGFVSTLHTRWNYRFVVARNW